MSEDQAPDIRVGHLQIRICGRSPVLDGLRDARAGAIVLSSSQRPDWDEFGSGTRSPVWAAVPLIASIAIFAFGAPLYCFLCLFVRLRGPQCYTLECPSQRQNLQPQSVGNVR